MKGIESLFVLICVAFLMSCSQEKNVRQIWRREIANVEEQDKQLYLYFFEKEDDCTYRAKIVEDTTNLLPYTGSNYFLIDTCYQYLATDKWENSWDFVYDEEQQSFEVLGTSFTTIYRKIQ